MADQVVHAPQEAEGQAAFNEFGNQNTSLATLARQMQEGRDSQAQAEPKESAPTSSDSPLRASAKTLGFSDDELSSLSDDQLQAEIAKIDRRAITMFQGQQQRFQPAQPPVPAAPTGPQQTAQAAAEPVQVDWNALEEEYDAGIVKPLRSLFDQVQQLNGLLQTFQSDHTAQQEAEFIRWFDGQITELGDDYHSVLGKGSIEQLTPYSAEYVQRGNLQEAFFQLRQLDATSSDEAIFRRTVAALYPQVQVEKTRGELAKQLKERQKTTIGRPSGKNAHPDDETRDPITGVRKSTIDRLQARIDRMQSGA